MRKCIPFLRRDFVVGKHLPNFEEPVTLTFIAVSIASIFAIVGVGIFLVQKFK